MPQAIWAPQSGHSVWPCLRAWVMSLARQRRCEADAVCAIMSPDLLWPLWASHGSCNGLGTVGGRNTLPMPCCSILGAVLFV